MQSIQAPILQMVCCPNCGSPAERHYYTSSHSQPVDRSNSSRLHSTQTSCVRTQCQRCDYLMVTCAQTGGVIEAYAPGIPFVSGDAASSADHSVALCR